MKKAKAYLTEGIRSEIPDIRFNSSEQGSPSILNISFLGIRGEVLLHALEQSKIYVSTDRPVPQKKGKAAF
jgi:cysteine desulfurase